MPIAKNRGGSSAFILFMAGTQADVQGNFILLEGERITNYV